jgi:hypothetical protein
MAPKRVTKHLETPQKNKIRGAAEFCEQQGISYTKTALARTFSVSRSQVDYALEGDALRTSKSSKLKAKNAMKLTERDLDHVELFLESNGFEGHELSWSELIYQFGFEVHPDTLRRRMAKRLVFTFVAVTKPFLDENLAELRLQWAKDMLAKYPKPEDWRHVRFSDEIHFGWGPEGRKLIIRPRGSAWRGHPDCIHRKETKSKDNPDDSKRLHFWAAVGYNFKSPLVPYQVPSNQNGKMTHQVYIESILEPIVSQWCLEDGLWCLEEDNDSGHGLRSKDNPVEKWKQAHGMSKSPSARFRYYPNCPQSPDFAIIEDVWQYPKQYVRKRPHWTDELVSELALEAWAEIPQDWINRLVDSMPRRLQDCIDAKGQLVEMRK